MLTKPDVKAAVARYGSVDKALAADAGFARRVLELYEDDPSADPETVRLLRRVVWGHLEGFEVVIVSDAAPPPDR